MDNMSNKYFKIIINRLEKIKEDENNNQKSRFIQVLENHNVSIYKDGKFRNLYDVLTDISSIWNELSDDEKLLFRDVKHYDIKR